MRTEPRTILIAEDEPSLRRAAEAALSRAGYAVLTAADGAEALERVRERTPELVLLDLVMPKLLGFEVLRRLKADPKTAHVPVIVMTSLSQDALMSPDSEVRQILAEGAVGYLVKANTTLESLVRRVDEFFASLEPE